MHAESEVHVNIGSDAPWWEVGLKQEIASSVHVHRLIMHVQDKQIDVALDVEGWLNDE